MQNKYNGPYPDDSAAPRRFRGVFCFDSDPADILYHDFSFGAIAVVSI
jgi:hypothetical protein